MRAVRILVSLLLMLTLLPVGLIGCNDAEPTDTQTEAPTEKPTEKVEEIKGEEISISENADKLKTWGRYEITDDGIVCDHTASGIEFNGVMQGTVYIDIKTNAETYFTVFVDGVRQRTRFSVSGGRYPERIAIAELKEAGEHNIRILKQTEARYSTAELQTLVIDGYLTEAPENRDYYIEFIGDSITCGMGNLGTSVNTDAQNATYEDGTYSYAFLASEDLGADCSVISQSGIGIAKSWFDPIKDFYTKLSYCRDKDTDYGFSRTPDMVVINLGTNDYYRGSEPEAVTAGAIELMELIRSSYGAEVTILWAYGAMGECMFDAVSAAIDTLGGEGARIYSCELTENTAGAAGHPNKSGHIIASTDLKNFIIEIKNK